MVASEITNMWVCSECEVMDDIWYVYMSGRSLLLHKPWCPQFLHSSCNGLIYACQVRSPCHIPLFLYLIQSCYYLRFLHQLLPHCTSCLTSHQKVLHILHLSTVTFCTLPFLPRIPLLLPPSTCNSVCNGNGTNYNAYIDDFCIIV